MALSPRGCTVLMALLLVAVVTVLAAPAVTAAGLEWTPSERHKARSPKAPTALPSAAAPAGAPLTPGLYPPHGMAAAAPGPTQGAEAPAPSPYHNDGAAAVPFACSSVLLVVAGVAAAIVV